MMPRITVGFPQALSVPSSKARCRCEGRCDGANAQRVVAGVWVVAHCADFWQKTMARYALVAAVAVSTLSR